MSGASSVEDLEKIIKAAGFIDINIVTKPVSREYEEKWAARSLLVSILCPLQLTQRNHYNIPFHAKMIHKDFL